VQLLWRQAALIWRAKGYTHTEAADALEARFGTNNGYGRSRITILVKTQCEPCPPEAVEFILSDDEQTGLKVSNAKRWARFQRELAAILEGGGRVSAASMDLRELAKESAALVMDTVRSWLDSNGAKLDTLSGKLESTGAKLDDMKATVTNTEAVTELINAKMDLSAHQRRRDKLHLMGAVCGMGLFSGLLTCVGRTPLTAPVQTVTVNVGPGAAEVAGRTLPGGMAFSFEFRNFLGALLSPELGKKAPEEQFIPDKPLPGQKLPPCESRLKEDAISGGCWAKMAYPPPCELLFRYGDACYRPIAADPLKPMGLAPQAPGQEQHPAQR